MYRMSAWKIDTSGVFFAIFLLRPADGGFVGPGR